MMKPRKYNNHGEIATILTIISTVLLVAGVAAGSFVAQRTTDTRSRAAEPSCSANDIENKIYLGIAEDKGIAGAQGCDCDEVNKQYVRWHRNCDCKPGGDCPNVYPELDGSCSQVLEDANHSCSFHSSSAPPAKHPNTANSCPSPYFCLENPICTAINGAIMPFSCSGTTGDVCCRAPNTPTLTTAPAANRPPVDGDGGVAQNNSISGTVEIISQNGSTTGQKLVLYYGDTKAINNQALKITPAPIFRSITLAFNKNSPVKRYTITDLNPNIKYAVVAVPVDNKLIDAVQASCSNSSFSPRNYCTDLDVGAGDSASFKIDLTKTTVARNTISGTVSIDSKKPEKGDYIQIFIKDVAKPGDSFTLARKIELNDLNDSPPNTVEGLPWSWNQAADGESYKVFAKWGSRWKDKIYYSPPLKVVAPASIDLVIDPNDDYNNGYFEVPMSSCKDNNNTQQTCPVMYSDDSCAGKDPCIVHRACSPNDPPDNWCQYTCIDTRINLQVPCWKGQKTDSRWLFPHIGNKCMQNDIPVECPYTYDDCGGRRFPCILYRACGSIRQLFSLECQNTCIDKRNQIKVPCPENPLFYLSPTPLLNTSTDVSGITGSTNVAIQKAMDKYAQGTLTATQRSVFINQLCRVSGVQFKSCGITADGSSLDCSPGC